MVGFNGWDKTAVVCIVVITGMTLLWGCLESNKESLPPKPEPEPAVTYTPHSTSEICAEMNEIPVGDFVAFEEWLDRRFKGLSFSMRTVIIKLTACLFSRLPSPETLYQRSDEERDYLPK